MEQVGEELAQATEQTREVLDAEAQRLKEGLDNEAQRISRNVKKVAKKFPKTLGAGAIVAAVVDENVLTGGHGAWDIHRNEDDETDVGVRVPVDVDGMDLPINFVKCPREEFDALLPEGYTERQYLGVYASCYDMDQFVYIGDCGGVQFQFAKAAETRVRGAFLAALFALALCFAT